MKASLYKSQLIRYSTINAIFFLLVSRSVLAQTDKQSGADAGIVPMAICPDSYLSPSSLYPGASGGVYTVDLISDCSTYSVLESLSWVSYTKTGKRVTLTISANSGPARDGVVTIAQLPLSIYQACGNYPGPAGSISGSNSVCPGQTGVSYYVSPVANASGYSWTLPAGASIVSGANTNSITVNFSSYSGSGNLTVYGTGCGTGSASPNHYVTVNTIGSAGSISGPSIICAGSTYTYSISAVSDAAYYVWTLPSGASGSSSSNSISVTYGSGGGTISVYAVNSAGCQSNTSSGSVSISTIYNGYTVTGGGTTCQGVGIPVGLNGSTSGVWYRCYVDGSLSTPSVLGTGGAISLGNKWYPGTYTVKGVTAEGCEIAMGGSVIINNYPQLTASISGGASPICYNTSPGTFTANGSGGTSSYSYLWYKDGVSTGITTQSYNPGALSANSSFYCAVTSGSCGTVYTSTKNILVHPNLTASSSGGNSPICYNTSPGTFSANGNGGTGSYSYQWYMNGIPAAPIQNYNPGALTSNSNFYCVVTSGSCGSVTTSTTNIMVLPNLTASISGGSSQVCYNTSPSTFTATGSGGTNSYTYLWYKNDASTGITTRNYDPGALITGSSFYCVITSGACVANTSVINITVHPDLTASISGGTSPVCYGTSPGMMTAIANGGTGSYTYRWYKNNVFTGVTTQNYNPGALYLTSNIYCAVTSGSCGTVNTTPVTITVLEATNVTNSPIDRLVTPGENASFSVASTGPNLQYQWQSGTSQSGPWADLIGPPASGFNSPDLTVQAPSTPGYGGHFRCRITSDCSTIYSGSASLTITLPEAVYLTGAGIPDPEGRVLNTSLPVGSTAASYNTGADGAATYEIPIVIPQGTGGMQPSVSLSYNSLGGNGALGKGWSMKGFSSITRMNKPYYADGTISAINLDGSDSYALDGNRLVLVNDASGFDGDIYKTEIEAFSEITSKGLSGNGPLWFEVKLRNGTVIRYGDGENSVVKAGNGSVLIWNITRITDRLGNYCEYIYGADPLTQNYLEKIKYTGNINTGLQPYNEIRFKYRKRADKNELYFPGLTVPLKLVLTGIDCISEGSVLRSYELNYANDLYSHLVELVEKGKNSTQLNSTVFDWGERPALYRAKAGAGLDPQHSIIYTGDINGDGNADMLTTPKKTTFSGSDQWKLFLGSPSGYELADDGYLNSDFAGFDIADDDNDGDDDVFWQSYKTNRIDCPAGDTIHQCYKDENQFAFYTLLNNQLTPDAVQDQNYIYEPVYDPGTDKLKMYPADFDGNGITDYMFVNANRNIEHFHNLTASQVPDLNSPDEIILIDFNGDSKTDLATIKNNSLKILQYNNNTHTFDVLLGSHSIGYLAGIGDFNGDGKTDFLSRNNSYIVETTIYYSTGNDLIAKTGPVTADLTPQPRPPLVAPFPVIYILEINLDMVVNDFNGDGRADIFKALFVTTRTYPEDGHYSSDTVTFFEDLYLSSGMDFQQVHVNDGVGRHSFYHLDNNHDGNSDLLITANWIHNEIFEFFPDDKSQLISSITDGKNLKTEISYGSMLDPSVYSRENETYSSQVIPVVYPAKLVSGITVYDNNNSAILEREKYNYTNLKMHTRGKGLLGFSKVLSRNLTTGHSSYARYSYDDTFYIPYLSGATDSINGNATSHITNSQAFLTFDNNTRYLPYNNTSSRADIINGTSVEKSRILDVSGNVTEESLKYYDSGHNLVKQVRTGFSDYSVSGLPGSISVINTRGTESITRSKSIVYSTTTGLVDNVTQSFGESPSLVTSYQYDNFGNNTSVVSVSGGETRQSTTVYEPDKGRFPVYRINALNDTLKYTYDSFGNILTATDISGLVTSNQYDDFGSLYQTTLPGSGIITNNLVWSPDAENAGELFYRQTSSTGNPLTREYYDILGRKKRTKTQSFDGAWLQADVEYDQAGRIENSYSPCFAGNTASQYVHYDYDELGRIIAETFFPQNNSVAYSYAPLGITVTKAGREFEKVYDATGRLITSTDPGGTISYLYNAEDKVRQVSSPSGNTIIMYDDYGYQDNLQDIDAGAIDYDYNAFGELKSQSDAKGNEQILTYDALGRILTKTWTGGETITWEYNPLNGQLKKLQSSNGIRKRFEYDELNRLKMLVDSIDNNNKFTAEYSYNQSGKIENALLNNTVSVDYNYNAYGYLRQVSAGEQTVWTANSMNQYGIVDNFTLGNGAVTSISYDPYGFVSGITTVKSGNNLQNWGYDFNETTGNLTSRTGLNTAGSSITEGFTWDALDRLKTYEIGQNTLSVNYDISGKGNITYKTDAGTYNYVSGVHNVDSLTNPTPLAASLPAQQVQYTKFGKVSFIGDSLSSSEERELLVTYGPDEERARTVYSVGSLPVRTKYFALGQYEKEIDSAGNIRELYYISASGGVVSVLEKKGGQDTFYYIHKDHLGSVDVISKPDGTVKERYNYDPWGRRRNPDDWSYNNVPQSFFLDRGFTGHEHLDQFGLINMNGRVYDPLMAMFLSPDKFIQNPSFTQNFNRYSYAFNNPLSYVDPTGNIVAPRETSGVEFWMWSSQKHGSSSFLNGSWKNTSGLRDAGPSNASYRYDPSSISGYRDQNGNEVPFSVVSSSLYNSGSLIGAGDPGRFLEYISSGFSIYTYNLYGRENLIASMGDPGLFSISGGGYGATNNTASVFPIIAQGQEVSGSNPWLNNTEFAGDLAGPFSSGAKAILKNRGAYMPHGQIYRVNIPVTVRTPFVNIQTTSKVLNATRIANKTLVITGVVATGFDVYNDVEKGNYYSAGTRAAVLGVGLAAGAIPVVGWGVALGIGIADYVWGDQFYNWVETKMR